MKNDEVVSKVNEVMHRGFEIPLEKLVPRATLFDELELDSLDAVDMLVHLEDKLGVKVAGERLMSVRTMQDVYDLVRSVSPGAQASAGIDLKGELSH